MHVKVIRMKQLTVLKTATSSLSFRILLKKCAQAGIERDLFGLVENTVYANLGNSNRNFWSNGKHPKSYQRKKNWLLFGERELIGS